MELSEYYCSLGLPANAVVTFEPGRLISIVPSQGQTLTAIIASGCAGELDVPDRLRAIRGKMLSLSDWTQAADSPLTAEQRAAWATYRQSLRDLPSVYTGEGPIPWPVAPA